MVFKFLIYFTLTLIGAFPVISQDVQNTGSSKIEMLKNGVLIVRLDMKQNSLDAYQDMLSQTNVEDKNYIVLKDRIEELKLERLTYKENVMEAMKHTYNFSHFCFIESQAVHKFLAGDYSVLICLEEEAIEMIENGNYFFLVKGDEDTHWIVVDKLFNKLDYPFPNSHNIGFMRLIDFIIGGNNYSLKNQSKVFSKMNIRFIKFYNNRISEK